MTNRIEAAANALAGSGVRFPDIRAIHAIKAADAHDAANGVHRVSLDDATLEEVEHAMYVHREGALTCYDHQPTPDNPIWCCPCGEHSISAPWRQHAARAVLSAAMDVD